jgi:hypothetical protein
MSTPKSTDLAQKWSQYSLSHTVKAEQASYPSEADQVCYEVGKALKTSATQCRILSQQDANQKAAALLSEAAKKVLALSYTKEMCELNEMTVEQYSLEISAL